MLVEPPPPPPAAPVGTGAELLVADSVADTVAFPAGAVALLPAPPSGGRPSDAVVKPEYEPVD